MTVSVEQLRAEAVEPALSKYTPKQWFERALRHHEALRKAERTGNKPEMYILSLRLVAAHTNARVHPAYIKTKAADRAWAARFADFMPTRDDVVSKAKTLKDELQAAEASTHATGSVTANGRHPGVSDSANSRPIPSPPVVEDGPGGSIADRMKALSGRGMDVGSSSKRISREYGRPSIPFGTHAPHQASSMAANTASHVESGADGSSGAAPTPSTTSERSQVVAARRLSAQGNPSGHRASSSLSQNGLPVTTTTTGSSAHSAGTGISMGSGSGAGSTRSSPTKPHLPLDRPPSIKESMPTPSSGHSSNTSQPHFPSLSREPTRESTHATSSGASLSPVRSPKTLPEPPQSPPQPRQNGDTDDLVNRFEAAFPSVDELGKQFETDDITLPAPPTHAHVPAENASSPVDPPRHIPPLTSASAESDEDGFPSFPSLPSVPKDVPGGRVPSPLSRPVDATDGHDTAADHQPSPVDTKAPSPPSPDLLKDLKRPASSPMLTDKYPGLSPPSQKSPLEALRPSDDPPSSETDDHVEPRTDGPTGPRPAPSHGPEQLRPVHPSQLVSFPKPSPSPTPSASKLPPSSTMTMQAPRRDFPLTNAIDPETLRSYFMNLGVHVLMLDVRKEFSNFVGSEYVGRHNEQGESCEINIVWLDPTVLMRPDLTSGKLEDALSLSPEGQQRAFEQRNHYDLVVIYDERSTNFPQRNSPPTPVSRLWDVIQEFEFNKVLPRVPVLLTGGYEGWEKYMKSKGGPTPEIARTLQQNGAALERKGALRQSAPDNFSKIETPTPNPRPQTTQNHYAREITENFNHDKPQSMSGGARMGHAQAASYSSGYGAYQPGGTYHGNSTYGGGSAYQGGSSYQGGSAYQGGSSYQGGGSYQGGHAVQRVTSPPRQLPRTSHMPSSSISSYSHAPSSSPYAHGTSASISAYSHAPSNSISSYGASTQSLISPPPQALVHHGASARRRSDHVADGQAYAGYAVGAPVRASIDYPQAHALPQPPPAAALPPDRVGPRRQLSLSGRNADQLVPNSGVRYWGITKLGLTGLKNLGNTCYMNSTVQCLSATLPFARYFLDGRYKREINAHNPLGTKGDLAHAFAELLSALWGENYTFLSPITFRKNIINFKKDFAGSEQHDSQEFLSFVMDGLHEDLNRIKVKPKAIEMTPEREHALETLPPQIASDKEWHIYKMRNDSLIVDLFQGQYMNRMECLTCHKTSTVYDSFQWLTLDLPSSKNKVVLPELFDRWVKPEVMDGDDKWYCPRCKQHRRASKTLSLVRLPPVLLIQLKRFIPEKGGRFWNKSETQVIFPLTGLDLTRYVPVRQPSGAEDMDDPRTQIGPFKYDLYAVSNHMGTLSSGHYTAYVKSSDQWMFCEDSRVQPAREYDVVSRPAYILFYKRVLA